MDSGQGVRRGVIEAGAAGGSGATHTHANANTKAMKKVIGRRMAQLTGWQVRWAVAAAVVAVAAASAVADVAETSGATLLTGGVWEGGG